MRIKCLLLLVLIIGYILNTVSAVDSICRFNGSVDLYKSDLSLYFSDQIGCGVQNVSESSSSLIIGAVVVFILLMIYGVFGKR